MNRTLTGACWIFCASLALGACAKRGKDVSVQAECTRMIKQAADLYDSRVRTLEKIQATRVANLIDAARIDQETGQHAACMDKASRAIVLANQQPAGGKSP